MIILTKKRGLCISSRCLDFTTWSSLQVTPVSHEGPKPDLPTVAPGLVTHMSVAQPSDNKRGAGTSFVAGKLGSHGVFVEPPCAPCTGPPRRRRGLLRYPRLRGPCAEPLRPNCCGRHPLQGGHKISVGGSRRCPIIGSLTSGGSVEGDAAFDKEGWDTHRWHGTWLEKPC